MNATELVDQHSLAGRTVLVAAGWTEGQAPDGAGPWDEGYQALAVDEAVVSLGRAVFARGGRIALVGDVDLALLLAMVAGEYGPDRPAEDLRPERERPMPSVLWIDLSEAAPERDEQREAEPGGAGAEPDPVLLMEQVGQLQRRHFPSHSWPALLGEVIRPDAVVCVGSPPGLELTDLRAFGEAVPGQAYALPSTGGLAAALTDSRAFGAPDVVMARTAAEVREASRRRTDERPGHRDFRSRDDLEGINVPRIPPFPLVAQFIAEGIGGGPIQV
jgi:hypothetical protein